MNITKILLMADDIDRILNKYDIKNRALTLDLIENIISDKYLHEKCQRCGNAHSEYKVKAGCKSKCSGNCSKEQ